MYKKKIAKLTHKIDEQGEESIQLSTKALVDYKTNADYEIASQRIQ